MRGFHFNCPSPKFEKLWLPALLSRCDALEELIFGDNILSHHRPSTTFDALAREVSKNIYCGGELKKLNLDLHQSKMDL